MITRLMATIVEPVAASLQLGAGGLRVAIWLGLGATASVVLALFWRRRRAEGDPLRRLAPPAGPLRLARELEVRLTAD